MGMNNYRGKKKMSLLKQKTNYDRIREMTVDEMAAVIANCGCRYCIYEDLPCTEDCCMDGVKYWLESEVTE